MAEERYKWNGKCPDCGAELQQKRKHNNYSVLNRIDFDCPKCGYWAEGWVRSNRKLDWAQELYYKNWKPHLWRETERAEDTSKSLSCDNKMEQEMRCPACEKYHAKVNALIEEKKMLEDKIKQSELKYGRLKTSRKCRKKWQKKMDKKMVTCEICGKRVMVAEKIGSKIVCMKCKHEENIWTG